MNDRNRGRSWWDEDDSEAHERPHDLDPELWGAKDNRPSSTIAGHRRRGGFLNPANGGKTEPLAPGVVQQLVKLYGLDEHASDPVLVALTIWHAPIDPAVGEVTDAFARLRWSTARGHAEAEVDVAAEGTIVVVSGADSIEARVGFTSGVAALRVSFEGQANYVGTVAHSAQRTVKLSAADVAAGTDAAIPAFARSAYVHMGGAGGGATLLRFLATPAVVLGAVPVGSTQQLAAPVPVGARFVDFAGAPPGLSAAVVFSLRI